MIFDMYAFARVAAATAAVFVAGVSMGAGAETHGVPYTLDVCSVSGEKFEVAAGAIVRVYDGRDVRLCSEGCLDKFEADRAKYFSIIDALILKQQRANYPIETCVVSGNKLTASVIDVLVYGRLVRYCCPNCLEAFSLDPDEYLAKLDRAVIAKQSAGYPFDVCLVSGEKLGDGGGAINLVLANRLVKLCSPGCAQKVKENPARFFAMLDIGTLDTEEGGGNGEH